MLQISVPNDDQSVYELTTKSGKTFLVRCPGTFVESEKDGLFCFVVKNDVETPTMFTGTEQIASFVKRPDVKIPTNAMHPSQMSDLMIRHLGEGAHGFQAHPLE